MRSRQENWSLRFLFPLIITKRQIKSWNFYQIIATETGPGRQSASADVIVNILDLNDNPPVFDRAEYRWT